MWEYPLQVYQLQWPEMYPPGGNRCYLSPMYWFTMSRYQTEPDTKSDTLRAWKLLRSMHWSFVTATQSPLTLPNHPKSPHGPKEGQQPFYHSHLHIHVQTFELQQLLQVPRGSVLRSKLQCSIQLYQDCLFQRLGQLSVVVIQPDCMSSSKMTCHTLGDGISWGMRLSLPETKLAKAQWLKFDYDYCASFEKKGCQKSTDEKIQEVHKDTINKNHTYRTSSCWYPQPSPAATRPME